MRRRWTLLAGGLLVFLLVSGSDVDRPACREREVQRLGLAGPLADASAEISGLAWKGDRLVVLPQFPERLGDVVFVLSREEIETHLDGDPRGTLRPRPIPFVTDEVASAIEGFDGYEAIAFVGDRVFVTVEAERRPGAMGWLLSGRWEPDPERIVIDAARRAALPAQTRRENLAYEALAASPTELLAFYEANGSGNAAPSAKRFGPDLDRRGDVPVGPLEYRVTDVTDIDAHGRLWALNYWWPGAAEWKPGPCPLRARFGLGETHAGSDVVERIVELEWTEQGIVPSGRAPVQLRLREDGRARNWEGIARLGDRGFVVVTDEHPGSILAFVAL